MMMHGLANVKCHSYCCKMTDQHTFIIFIILSNENKLWSSYFVHSQQIVQKMNLSTSTCASVRWSPWDGLCTAEWVFIKFCIQELYWFVHSFQWQSWTALNVTVYKELCTSCAHVCSCPLIPVAKLDSSKRHCV